MIPRTKFPLIVDCNARGVGKERKVCGGSALYESENPRQRHAFYRCQRPGCKNLMVVCANGAHA